MLTGRAYYMPISAEGQVIEKQIVSVRVTRERDESEVEDPVPEAPELRVVYTLTNPYAHPVPVPIQSGLTILYQYAKSARGQQKPELHVVPSTVTDQSHGEILYLADDAATAAGTAAVQRYHLGTGVPNYRHALAVSRTLVPGATLTIEAHAQIPERVERMILVDTMVGPDRPYGIYPQLLDEEKNPDQTPPPIRLYEGALFQDDPPHVQLPRRIGDERARRGPRLPRWLTAERYSQLRTVFGNAARQRVVAVSVIATILSTSMLVRYAILGQTIPIVVEGVRIALIGAFAGLLVRGVRAARWILAGILGASGLFSMGQMLSLVVRGTLEPAFLLTELTLIPMLYLLCSGVIAISPAIRSLTRQERNE